MNKSENIGELFGALALAKLEYKTLKKSKWNPFFKSYYADLSDVIEATDNALSNHGLTVIQGADVKEGRAVIHTILGHKSGQWVDSSLSLKVDKDTAQGAGAAMTYGQRYSWQAIVGISAEPDDDGNAATPEEDKPKQTVVQKEVAQQVGAQYQAALEAHAQTIMKFNITNEPQLIKLVAALTSKGVPESIHDDVAKELDGKPFSQTNIGEALARVTKK